MMNILNTIWSNTTDSLKGKFTGIESLFEEIPVSPKEFFKHWLKPELSQPQLKAVESIFKQTEHGQKWSDKYNEYLLLWGEGSGKDFICSRILTYCAYYLMCMKNPQAYFNLANNEAIDLVNVSLSGKHAKNVFFYKLKHAIRGVRNPHTQQNWFKEKGMDLRDSKDIKTLGVEFKKGVRAHSLNSQTYGGEGLNVLIAVFDEVGEFRVTDAEKLYENLKHTETSRYGNLFKLFLISYMRHENDFMMYRWEKTKNSIDVYRSKGCTWEVNPLKKREDFNKAYTDDPEGSARRYENRNLKVHENRFIQFPDRVKRHVNFNRKSPFVEEKIYCTDLLEVDFETWFRPRMTEELYKLLREEGQTTEEREMRKRLLFERHKYATYYIHIDLAKANVKKKNDCGGIAMVHKYIINPFDTSENGMEWGVYVDFMMQLRGEPELDFEMIRRFIYRLRDDKSFSISKVTLDGYESVDFKQLLSKREIETEILSVDKTKEPYNDLKSLIYTNRLDYYKYSVFEREMIELEDNKDKIDHPDLSKRRAVEEKLEYGSKDVSDAVAGATHSCLNSKETGQDSDWISV